MVRWILLDLALALLAVTGLALLLLRLWGKVKVLTRTVGEASELIAQATFALGELPRPGTASTPSAPPGVPRRSSRTKA